MFCANLAPKTFLGRYPLKKGAIVAGALMICISIICVISLSVELAYYQRCENCTPLVIQHAYSFSIDALIYCIFMVAFNIWFIWGSKREKSSVVLCWVVVNVMWWAQSIIFVIVLLCMHITGSHIGWMAAVACTLIAFMIFAYCILVGYGYWLEIRKTRTVTVVRQNNVERQQT